MLTRSLERIFNPSRCAGVIRVLLNDVIYNDTISNITYLLYNYTFSIYFFFWKSLLDNKIKKEHQGDHIYIRRSKALLLFNKMVRASDDISSVSFHHRIINIY